METWVRELLSRARGLGANVTVVEVDPVKAIEAYMEGYPVKRINQVVDTTDIFITCTGQTNVITDTTFQKNEKWSHTCKRRTL